MSGKIIRLLEFSEKKGCDYDQNLDCKSGISNAGEILTLYKNKMGLGIFEYLLTNSLDETLVKNISTIENWPDLNIKDTSNLGYKEFSKYLYEETSWVICPTPD